MERHVTILGAFHIAFGAIGLVIALAILVIFGGAAGLIGVGAASDPDALIAVPIVALVGTILMMAALLLSVPGIAAGFGLMTYRPWARMLTVVLSLLHLFNFPFGSALGVYGPVGAAVGRRAPPLRAALSGRLRRQRLRAAFCDRPGDALC